MDSVSHYLILFLLLFDCWLTFSLLGFRMKTNAKKEYREVKKNRSQTGGGFATEMSSVSSYVVEVIEQQMEKPSSSFDSDAQSCSESPKPRDETALGPHLPTKRPSSPKRAKRQPDDEIIEMARERHAAQMEILRIKKQNELLKTEILQHMKEKLFSEHGGGADVMAAILDMH